MARQHRFAASLTVGATGILVWAVLALLGPWATVSYGAVADQIRAARTIQYHVTATANGVAAPEAASKVYMKEPGHLRIESAAATIITDAAAEQTLSLDPRTQSAHLVTIKAGAPVPHGGPFDSVESFKKLAEAKGEPIADRKIGDVNAKGFELHVNDQNLSMWVDPKTRLPLRIESSALAGGQQVQVVLSDFVFDQPLDDALFNVTPPPGFTVIKTELNVPNEGNLAEAVAAVLRAYTARTDGRFPKALGDWGDFATVFSKGSRDGTLDPTAQEALAKLGTLSAALTSLSKGKDYDYTPGDTRLGDANKIVFWSRQEDNGKYRAVFGDLSIKDVDPAQVVKQ